MNGRRWLREFFRHLHMLDNAGALEYEPLGVWTESFGKVHDAVAEELCFVLTRRRQDQPPENGYRAEYLTIDHLLFNAYDFEEYGLPLVALEHEHLGDEEIKYAIWKVCALRAPLKVVVGYKNDLSEIRRTVEQLDEICWEHRLYNSQSEIIVMLADGTKNRDDQSWTDYYHVYEWRGERFSKVPSTEFD